MKLNKMSAEISTETLTKLLRNNRKELLAQDNVRQISADLRYKRTINASPNCTLSGYTGFQKSVLCFQHCPKVKKRGAVGCPNMDPDSHVRKQNSCSRR